VVVSTFTNRLGLARLHVYCVDHKFGERDKMRRGGKGFSLNRFAVRRWSVKDDQT
jgi:hypothetical protein